ncbi:MAG TPA: hypothetical protein PKA27_15685 [Fimbriimonadaceae bacterium]|nr:hypothetical protein [Fimbriimonadaceae bacterium]
MRLQASSPGVAQDDNANVTGKIKAGSLQLTNGVAANRYLLSDAGGIASWSPLNLVALGPEATSREPTQALPAITHTSLAKV